MRALVVALCPTLAGTPDAAGEALRAITVTGARFEVITMSGRVLPQNELVGAVLSYSVDQDMTVPVRIDGVRPDPKDPSGEVLLYDFSTRDPARGLAPLVRSRRRRPSRGISTSAWPGETLDHYVHQRC
jgi:hypothetical protein